MNALKHPARPASLIVAVGLAMSVVAAGCNRESKTAALELLPPTGPLSLGRTSYHWVDEARTLPSEAAGTKREVMAHLWYPADRPADAAPAPYLPEFAAIQAAVGEKLLRDEAGASYDGLVSARTHVVADAPLDQGADKYPVVLLTHGLRFQSLGYSMLAEDLASHGYVVVGIDHPATAFAVLFPGNRVTRFDEQLWTRARTEAETRAFERTIVDRCAEDLAFALDQLERLDSGDIPSAFQGRLDLGRVAVIGHSFGGRVAARACQLDGRLKAGAILDGFGRAMLIDKNPDGSTVEQPMMVQYARRVPASGISRILALLQTPGRDLEAELRKARQEFCKSVKSVSYEVTLSTPDIVHESFSDIPWLESGQSAATRRNRRRAIEIIRSYTLAFLDRHLRGARAPLLDNVSPDTSEVELVRHTFRGQ